MGDPHRPGARPVAVTGLGAVSGYGWGVDALWRGLRSGVTAIGDFDRFDHRAHRTHTASQVPWPADLQSRPVTSPGPYPIGGPHPADKSRSQSSADRRLSLTDHYALAAATEALAGAGLMSAPPGTAVFFGSSTGGMLEGEMFYSALTQAEHPSAPIGLLAGQQTNAPGDAVARALRCSGPVETISSACASTNLALEAALGALRRGDAAVALAGGADGLCQLTFGGFNALRSVSPDASLPFRAGRLGLSIGEGGAVLVLETLEHARARGATVLALLSGAGSSCDAQHMTAPDPTGRGAARAIARAIDDAQLTSAAIDFINVHGTGTPLNDASEWEALRAVFGDRAGSIPVTSTKGAVGHLLGSAGAIEAVVTVLCLRAGEVHPTPGDGPVDPEAPVDLVLGGPRALARARAALSTNLAFGGSNAAIILERVEG